MHIYRTGQKKHKQSEKISNLSTYNKKKDGNFRNIYFKEKRINYPPNNERISKKIYRYKI